MGKKIVVPCLDVIMITVLSRHIWWKSIPVSSEVRFCSCKEPRPLATWTRLLSRKGFKVNKNAKVCSNHFKFCGRTVDSHPHPTFFLKGYYREIVTRKRKAPIDRLPVQPIRTEKKKSDTDSIQREKKRNNIVDTPKKLLWSFGCSIYREKGDHYYIQTRHNDIFSHYNLILAKRYEKNCPEKRA